MRERACAYLGRRFCALRTAWSLAETRSSKDSLVLKSMFTPRTKTAPRPPMAAGERHEKCQYGDSQNNPPVCTSPSVISPSIYNPQSSLATGFSQAHALLHRLHATRHPTPQSEQPLLLTGEVDHLVLDHGLRGDGGGAEGAARLAREDASRKHLCERVVRAVGGATEHSRILSVAQLPKLNH